MKIGRPVLMALMASFVASGARPAPTTPLEFAPALKIGELVVSRYLFDKAYHRFIASKTSSSGEKPNQNELDYWFRSYVAQRMMEADLAQQNQLNRPEVVEITSRMVRYMLIQPHGVLYGELGGINSDILQRERRRRILHEAGFSPLPENIARLWETLRPSFSRGVLPRQSDIARMESSVLAEYSFGGEKRQISATDFVADFQQGIARFAPRDVPSLTEQIEDMAVAEYDLAEAKQRRLDQTPQFLEERRNFALIQARILYEREVLHQQVTISANELQKRYRVDKQRFSSPVEIIGTLFVDTNREKVRRASRLAVDRRPFLSAKVEQVVDPFVIRRDKDALPGISYAFLVSIPIGQTFGTFAYKGKYAVFLKRAVGKLEPRSFQQVRPELQRELMREKIEALEWDHLARNVERVQVYVDLASYGLRPLRAWKMPSEPRISPDHHE